MGIRVGSKNTVFALITDFGFDFSVASMKALILKELPNSQIVDIDHNIKQFSVLSGAFVIDKIFAYFPKGNFWDVLKNSVHVNSHLSRNSRIFSFISGTVHVYDNYTREISLLWRFSATSRWTRCKVPLLLDT